jgi:hypothetical protein
MTSFSYIYGINTVFDCVLMNNCKEKVIECTQMYTNEEVFIRECFRSFDDKKRGAIAAPLDAYSFYSVLLLCDTLQEISD